MKITTVSYYRTVNLGNYESKRMEVTAEIGDDESLEECTIELIERVHRILGIAPLTREPIESEEIPFP